MSSERFYHPSALVESEEVGEGTRVWAYAHVMSGAKIGRNCNIGDHAFIERGAVVGDNVTIKNGVCVWEGVTLADGVFVGPHAVFTNDMFPRSPRLPVVADRYAHKERWLRPTRVEEGVTVGANATIVCGVTLGAWCFIAAGAIVHHDVEPHALMIGVPARRHGWVCHCARPLVVEEYRMFCPECGRKYEEMGK
jgi:UDP-2-acetamido-3-amino-2,3-dideoxy-glucuronate N-acetyltransferase